MPGKPERRRGWLSPSTASVGHRRLSFKYIHRLMRAYTVFPHYDFGRGNRRLLGGMKMEATQSRSWASRTFGSRSIFSWIFGTFFSDSTNTSGLLAIILVISVLVLFFRNGQ